MKNNILKIFAVLLTVVMLFVLASCGKDNKSSETKQEKGAGTTDSETLKQSSAENEEEKEKTEGEIIKDKPSDASKTDKDNQTIDKTTEASDPSGNNEDSKPADTDKIEDTSSSSDTEQQEKLPEEDEKIGSGKSVELPIIDPNS